MTATKLKLKPRPSNLDLQDQVAEVHECLENVGATVAHQQVQLEAVCRALGINLPTAEQIAAGVEPKPVNPRLGSLKLWQAAGIAVPVITGAMGLYHVLEPAVVAFVTTLHQVLMALR